MNIINRISRWIMMVHYWYNGNLDEVCWSMISSKIMGYQTQCLGKLLGINGLYTSKCSCFFCWWLTSPLFSNKPSCSVARAQRWVMHHLRSLGPTYVPGGSQENCPILYISERFPVKLGKRHQKETTKRSKRWNDGETGLIAGWTWLNHLIWVRKSALVLLNFSTKPLDLQEGEPEPLETKDNPMGTASKHSVPTNWSCLCSGRSTV